MATTSADRFPDANSAPPGLTIECLGTEQTCHVDDELYSPISW